MKVEIDGFNSFKPIKVSILIESESELRELWHRTNIAMHAIKDCSSYYRESFVDDFQSNSVINLWDALEQLRLQFNIRP